MMSPSPPSPFTALPLCRCVDPKQNIDMFRGSDLGWQRFCKSFSKEMDDYKSGVNITEVS